MSSNTSLFADAMPSQSSTLHALFSSASNEWYTPSVYVEAAREVMGGIDLDPASCAMANELVQASTFYTKEQNGLAQEWHGRVWCNPPYGTTQNRSNAGLWIRRIVADYRQGKIEQAVILVNSHTDARWFHQLFEFPVCFTEGRINFFAPKHRTDTSFSRTTTGMTHGSAFAYLGPNESRFISVFSQFGRIVRAIDTPRATLRNLSLWESEAVG